MKILVTGFEPFGGDAVNPSAMAVDLLPEQIEDAAINEVEDMICCLLDCGETFT